MPFGNPSPSQGTFDLEETPHSKDPTRTRSYSATDGEHSSPKVWRAPKVRRTPVLVVGIAVDAWLGVLTSWRAERVRIWLACVDCSDYGPALALVSTFVFIGILCMEHPCVKGAEREITEAFRPFVNTPTGNHDCSLF